MREGLTIAMCLIALLGGRPALAASPPSGVHMGVCVSQWSGSTSYEMSAKAESPTEPGALVDIRSTLEFPLRTTLLGVVADWGPDGTAGRWSLSAGVHKNLEDPSGRMTDEDWVGTTQIAYTESDAELDVLLATADVRYMLPARGRTSTSLLLHLDYQRIAYHVVGYEGWRGSLFSDDQVPVSGTAPVVDYAVTYAGGQLGAGLEYAVGTRSTVGASATVGVVHASDRDDHLLRGRIAEGEGWGVGVNARATLDLLPGSARLDWLSLGLVGEFRYFHAVGSVDQRWYRDEDLPSGTVIADLPYQMDSLQFQFSAELGVCF